MAQGTFYEGQVAKYTDPKNLLMSRYHQRDRDCFKRVKYEFCITLLLLLCNLLSKVQENLYKMYLYSCQALIAFFRLLSVSQKRADYMEELVQNDISFLFLSKSDQAAVRISDQAVVKVSNFRHLSFFFFTNVFPDNPLSVAAISNEKVVVGRLSKSHLFR